MVTASLPSSIRLSDSVDLFPFSHGKDGLSSVSELPGNPFPEVDAHPFHMIPREETDASQAILDILEREPVGTVHIAAVGPLTNLAKAWQKDPKTFAKVGRISVMGGSLEEPGNVSRTCVPPLLSSGGSSRAIRADHSYVRIQLLRGK